MRSGSGVVRKDVRRARDLLTAALPALERAVESCPRKQGAVWADAERALRSLRKAIERADALLEFEVPATERLAVRERRRQGAQIALIPPDELRLGVRAS